MAFPEKTKFFQNPIGWKDLGKVDDVPSVENGSTVLEHKIHPVCASRLAVGKENGEIFTFCPRCLVKYN